MPECSNRVLEDYGIPGMDVQRWMRHWETTGEFKKANEYRENSMAVISTHDTSPLLAWWAWEAGSKEDRQKFWDSIGLSGAFEPEPSKKLIEAALTAVNDAKSVLSIQLLQDWLALGDLFQPIDKDYRINKPGLMDNKNWRLRLPVSLEAMQKLPLNKKIFSLNRDCGRIH